MASLDKIGQTIGTALGRLESSLRQIFVTPANAVGGGAHPAEPAEIRRAILRQIGDRVESRGGGNYIFPYSAIDIELFAADAERQAALEAAFASDLLRDDVASIIRERHCSSTPDVDVSVEENAERATSGAPFNIKWLRTQLTPRVQRPQARLTVLSGQADALTFEITRDRTYLGRMKEVTDRKAGLIRRNDLAFDESETTVARRHAAVLWDAKTARFRVLNDSSNQVGTTIIRDGAVLRCDSTLGAQLHSGDEICLGKARVKFELVTSPDQRPAPTPESDR